MDFLIRPILYNMAITGNDIKKPFLYVLDVVFDKHIRFPEVSFFFSEKVDNGEL